MNRSQSILGDLETRIQNLLRLEFVKSWSDEIVRIIGNRNIFHIQLEATTLSTTDIDEVCLSWQRLLRAALLVWSILGSLPRYSARVWKLVSILLHRRFLSLAQHVSDVSHHVTVANLNREMRSLRTWSREEVILRTGRELVSLYMVEIFLSRFLVISP